MFKALIAGLAISSSVSFAIQFDEQDVNVARALQHCRRHLSNRVVNAQEARRERSAFDAAAQLLQDRIDGKVAPYFPVPAEAFGH